MTIEELKEKVRLAEEKCAKIEKTIERHKTQGEKKIAALNKIMEQNNLGITYNDVREKSNWYYDYQNKDFYHEMYWTVCDIRDKESAVNDNLKKLKDAQRIVQNWKEKLRLEEVKLQYIQDHAPQVIKDFLEQWKRRVIAFYTEKAEAYDEAYKQYKEDLDRTYFELACEAVETLTAEDEAQFIEKYSYGRKDRYIRLLEILKEGYKPDNDLHYYLSFGYRDPFDPRKQRRYLQIEEEFEARFTKYPLFEQWRWQKPRFNPEWLEKVIEEDKKNRLYDFMTKVSKITGEILDASNLSIGRDGNVNGFVIGKDGKADVKTIGAGGYNEHVILDSGRHGQCYHYRLLILPRTK